MSVAGIWDLTISTPIGRIEAVVALRREDGVLAGSAYGGRGAAAGAADTPGAAAGAAGAGTETETGTGADGERVELREVALDGDRLTWRQSVTKPMRLNLGFAVTIDGDTLSGTAKAGRLPSSKVVGVRRPGPAADASAEGAHVAGSR